MPSYPDSARVFKPVMPLSIGFPLSVLFVIGVFLCFNGILLGDNLLPTYLGLFPLLAVLGIVLKAPWGVSLARVVIVLGYVGAAVALLSFSGSTERDLVRIGWISGILLGVGILTIAGGLLSSRSAKAYLDGGSLK